MSGKPTDFQDGDLRVVVNHEEQYSIWPMDRDIPAGWKEVGFTGNKKDCLEHIKKVWTDLRPLSLRTHMKELEENSAIHTTKEPVGRDNDAEGSENTSRNLVDFLSAGDHPIELDIQSETKKAALQKSIDQGYVVVRFLDTRGTTELGISLERDRCVLGNGNLDTLIGRIQIVGTLRLNDERVRCLADINLEDCTGTGHLERI